MDESGHRKKWIFFTGKRGVLWRDIVRLRQRACLLQFLGLNTSEIGILLKPVMALITDRQLDNKGITQGFNIKICHTQ